MISNGKDLFDLVDELLKKEGFVKKKGTWYRHSQECICFFYLHKCPYGGYYEHVFGFFIKQLNHTGKEYPVFYKCNLKISLDEFADKELVMRVFNLENQEFINKEREFLITEFFELYILPFLKEVSSSEGIISVMSKYKDLIYYVDGEAMEYLKLKHPNSPKS